MGLQKDLLEMPCSFSHPTCQKAEGMYLGVFRHLEAFDTLVNFAGVTLARTDYLSNVLFPINPRFQRPVMTNVRAFIKNPDNNRSFPTEQFQELKNLDFYPPGDRSAIIRIPEEEGFYLAKSSSMKTSDINAPWVVRRPIVSDKISNEDFDFLNHNLNFFL